MRINTPILSTTEKATQDALKDAGREILRRSNGLAPRDDGDLVKSGRALVDDMTMQVSYTAVHARFQHENLDYEHADGGQPKFLEAAGDMVDVEAIVAAKIRAAFSG